MDVAETSGWGGSRMRDSSIREAESQVQISTLKLETWTSVSQAVPGHKHHRNIREGKLGILQKEEWL